MWEARAIDEKHAIPRAIKLSFQADPKARERFRREVELLTLLKGDAYIVGIHDAELDWTLRGEDLPECAFLVMDRAHGSLKELSLTSDSPTRVLRYFREACAGIGAMHAQSILHRDISPGNLLVLEEANRVVVADLGLAKRGAETPAQGEALTGLREAGGTENYRAPEVSQGGLSQATERSDIYALGRVLEFLLTRQTPDLLDPRPVPRGHLLSEEACAALDDVIRRATRHKPDERFASIAELVAALPNLVVGIDCTTPTRGTTASTPSTSLPKVVIEATSLVSMTVPRVPGDVVPQEKERVLVISVENHDAIPITFPPSPSRC